MRPIDTTLENAVRRDRLVILALLSIVIALSWVYLLAGAGMGMSTLEMTRMSQPGITARLAAAMLTPADWTLGYTVLMFFMWWAMMIAMMLPSAAPMILLFATLNRRQEESEQPYVATAVFVCSYLAAWAGFSLIAVTLQWMFESAGFLSPTLVGTNTVFGSSLLLAAGIYQLSPLKHACLRHCKSPAAFLSSHWRKGAKGALSMGLVHGAFCVGCCWFLMGLLFFGGVMNLYWISGIALFVMLEKSIAVGSWLSYVTGMALIGAGVLVFVL